MALAPLAGRQWGVVSLAQLHSLGVGRSGVTRRVQGGRLRRLHRGVYAVGGAVLPREGRWLAAVLACGPGAVLSHVSAAVHWNLLGYELARPRSRPPRPARGPGDPPARSHALGARDITTHQGIPTTTLARTLLDIAARVSPHHLERALAQSERLQLYDHRALLDVIQRSNGHRGTRTLTTAIAGDPQFTRGELEALMNELARDHGRPQPECNTSVVAHDGRSYEVEC
jgi:predicted transcriptional regulator of viral defense system